MPGLDGAGFVRMVRSPETFPHPDIPIIMLTGHGERSRVVEAVSIGVNEFLLKPVSSKSLQDRLVAVLTKPRPMVQQRQLLRAGAAQAGQRPCRWRRGGRQSGDGELVSGGRAVSCAASGTALPTALIAIDQGTTSTRAIAFDAALKPLASAQQELRQIYPAPGLVEHDPEEIWAATVATVRAAMAEGRPRAPKTSPASASPTSARPVVIWDRASGKPIHNAIVWQDRRTAEACDALQRAGHEAEIAAKTGLLLDPYFSASKIAWLLDHVEGARAAAARRAGSPSAPSMRFCCGG